MNTIQEKENQLQNSKLEMSIRPFNTIRDDLGKSKSVEKGKRGISRVKSTDPANYANEQSSAKNHHKFMFTSSGNNFHTGPSNAEYSSQTAQQQNNLFYEQSGKTMNHEYQNFMRKLELMEADQVVLERQNADLEAEMVKWKQQYGRLFTETKQASQTIKELQEQLLEKDKSLSHQQEELQKKERAIQRLLKQSKQVEEMKEIDDNKICEKYEGKIDELLNQLERVQFILKEKKEEEQNKRGYQYLSTDLQKQLRETKEEKIEAKQRHRQLLIKYSAIEGENNTLQNRNNFLKKQCQKLAVTVSSLEVEIENLAHELSYHKREAQMSHKYREEAEKYKSYYFESQQLKSALQQNEQRIKDLEYRRISQIQYHQEEIKRMEAQRFEKSDRQSQICLQERDEARLQMKELQSLIEQKDRKNRQIISQMTQDYESLILQMKDKMSQGDIAKEQTIQSQALEIRELQTEIKSLKDALRNAEGDKELLLNKIKQKNQLESICRSGNKKIPKAELNVSRRNLSVCSENAEHIQLGQLQETNRQITTKIKQYEMQMIKLEDKAHIIQIESQKNKDRADTYERKMKHLQEQIDHYEAERSKAIEEKVRLVEEIQFLKRDQLSKQQIQNSLNMKIDDQQIKICQLEKEIKEFQNNVCIMREKNINLQEKLGQKNLLIDSLQEENSIFTERYDSHVKKLQNVKEELQTKQAEIVKFKQCIELLKSENELSRQKNKVKEYLSRKEDSEDFKIRMDLLEKLFVALGSHSCFSRDLQETETIRKLISVTYQHVEKFNGQTHLISQLERKLRDSEERTGNDQNLRAMLSKYQSKCEEYERLIIGMEDAHKDKLKLVKEDYDIVYAKYLKYRNMVVAKIPPQK